MIEFFIEEEKENRYPEGLEFGLGGFISQKQQQQYIGKKSSEPPDIFFKSKK